MGPQSHQSKGKRLPLLSAAALLAVTCIVLLVAGCSATSSVTTQSTTAVLSTVVTQGSGANAEGPEATFTINNGTLNPTRLEVPVGSAVTWMDTEDDTQRTYEFVADNGAFDTGILNQGGSYTYTFQKAGTYDFHEKNDPSIKGVVIVQ